MRRLFFAMLLLILPSAVMAQDCSSGAVDARQVGTDDYDPSDLVQSVVRLSLRLTDDCDLAELRIVPRDSNVFTLVSAGATLQSVQSDAPEARARNISEFQVTPLVIERLKNGDEVSLDLLDLEPGQYVQSGNYQSSIDLVANGRTVGTILINVLVSPTVRLLGAAEAGNIDLDLGRLNDGVTAQQSIYFRSNAQVTLQITSDNGGKLVHERGTQFGSIPYVSSINGATIIGSSPANIPLGGFSGQLTEAVVGIEIAPVRSAFAGIYRDVITLSFIAF